MPDPRLAGAGQAPLEDRLQGLALSILEERGRRRWHFPRGVFGEIAWEMLLLLYASGSRPLSIAELADGTVVPQAVVERWIDYLERECLIGRAKDLDGSPLFHLNSGGRASLELYLRDRLQRSEAVRPGGTQSCERLPLVQAVGLLVIAAAILSGALAWWLATA